MEQDEKDYTKGFNNGYLLAKFEPDLFDCVTKQLSPINVFLEGFFHGKEEFEREKTHAQLAELHKLRDGSKEHDHNQEL